MEGNVWASIPGEWVYTEATDVSDPTSCLHHFLPEPAEHSTTSRLRTHEKYPRVFVRTKRYCSFIQYALNHTTKTVRKRNNVNKHNKNCQNLAFWLSASFVNDSCYYVYRYCGVNNYCAFNF